MQVDDLAVLASVSKEFYIDVVPEATANTVGTRKVSFRLPYAFTITGALFSVGTAPTGSAAIFDIKQATVSIYTTKPQVDISGFSSFASTQPGVLTSTTGVAVAANAEITVDVSQIGSTVASSGLKLILQGRRTT